MANQASISGVLTPTQVTQTQSQSQAITNTAQPGAIASSQFVFFAAFDGTNNDRNNLAVSGDSQPTNVGQLWSQYELNIVPGSNFRGGYYAGVGTQGTPWNSSWLPPQATAGIIQIAEQAYSDFTAQGSAWLAQNPNGSVTAAFASFSRGYGSAAIFSQMLYERGLVDPGTGKVLVAPGQIGISAGVIFDPVTTGINGSLGMAPNTQNVVDIGALDDYRYLFKGTDMTGQPGVTSLFLSGNHGNIGGGYDNGIGAFSLQGATGFLQASGLPMSNVPASRQVDFTKPFNIYNEGINTFGAVIWSTYGTYGDGTARLTDPAGKPTVATVFDDGSSASRFTTYQGKDIYTSKDGDGGTTMYIFGADKKLEKAIKIAPDHKADVITLGGEGVENIKQYDQGGNLVSNTAPVTANGTETNTLSISVTPTASTSQTGVEGGGVESDGTHQVSATNPNTLNNNQTAVNASGETVRDNTATAGDAIAAGFVRPGDETGTSGSVDVATLDDLELGSYFASGLPDPVQVAVNLASLDAGGQVTLPTDPLVLDLNGDGVHLTDFNTAPVLFDVDHDGGSLEQTGWVSAADGILVHDLNANNKIDGIHETLSEYYNGAAGSNGTPGAKPYTNGFTALKSLDSNNDNVFNSLDASWSHLRVWVDANHDGKTDTGELKTFGQLNITSINLAATTQSGLVRDGNEVLATGTFVQNGQTKEALAANLIANPFGNTTVTLTNGILTLTEGDAAVGKVKTYVSTSQTGEVINLETVDNGNRVDNAFGGTGNDTLNGTALNNWLAGGRGSDVFNAGAGNDVLLIDSEDLQQNIHAGAGIDIVQAIGNSGITLNLTQAEAEIAHGGDGNDVLIGGGRYTVYIRGGAGDDIIIGGAANDALSGEDGTDLLDGGQGNDVLRGDRGRDVLLGGAGQCSTANFGLSICFKRYRNPPSVFLVTH